MKNIQLNPGGVIGAIVLMAAAIVIVLVIRPDDLGRRAGGLGVLALFLGAYGGNFVWDRLFPKGE